MIKTNGRLNEGATLPPESEATVHLPVKKLVEYDSPELSQCNERQSDSLIDEEDSEEN
jgi:hypothetical protein